MIYRVMHQLRLLARIRLDTNGKWGINMNLTDDIALILLFPLN